jgi:hypothetical protein
MLMRSTAHFTSETAATREIAPSDKLTIRERIVETGDWTISIPAIATVSVSAERRSIYRGALLTGAGMAAVAGLANYVVALVTPTLPILVAALALTAIFALLSVRTRNSFVLAFTANDGSRCSVTSKNQAALNEIRTFLTEKINRQDCRACRVFHLNGEGPNAALGVNEALRAISERADATAVAVNIAPDVPHLDQPIALVPVDAPPAPRDASCGVDYSSVLAQVTDLHRFYERHPQAAHIRERLSEMELLMRSGTPSAPQQVRVRELALDLSNIMSAYPQMTQLFGHVTRLVSR